MVETTLDGDVVKVIEQLFEDCDGNIQMQTEFAE
jgi:hypothetical protein